MRICPSGHQIHQALQQVAARAGSGARYMPHGITAAILTLLQQHCKTSIAGHEVVSLS